MRIKLNIQLSSESHELKMRIVHIHSVLQKTDTLSFNMDLSLLISTEKRSMDSTKKSQGVEREFSSRRKKEEGMRASH